MTRRGGGAASSSAEAAVRMAMSRLSASQARDGRLCPRAHAAGSRLMQSRPRRGCFQSFGLRTVRRSASTWTSKDEISIDKQLRAMRS